jgi:hypothetical protein
MELFTVIEDYRKNEVLLIPFPLLDYEPFTANAISSLVGIALPTFGCAFVFAQGSHLDSKVRSK